MEDTKICGRSDCVLAGVPQPFSNFSFRYGKPITYCKKCVVKYVTAWKNRNEERRRQYLVRYHKERRDGIRQVHTPLTVEQQKETLRRCHKNWWDAVTSDPERYADQERKRREYIKEWRKRPETQALLREQRKTAWLRGYKCAMMAVKWAVDTGRIIPTGKCSYPDMGDKPCKGKLEWHHYNGYEPENWLDAKEVCVRHHRILTSVERWAREQQNENKSATDSGVDPGSTTSRIEE